MVIGLDRFRKHFAPYTDQYILIGGTACTLVMQEAGFDFRATKDLDIVLYVEALREDFVRAFWLFVEEGGYANRQHSTSKDIFYRFSSPNKPDYPAMLELFSRIPDGVKLSGQGHLTPIPIDESIASLSAILLDEDYYHFIHSGKIKINDLPILHTTHLIPIKARAYIDLLNRKMNGEKIDDRDIRKHKNDVIRLFQLLSPESRIKLPIPIQNDFRIFLADIKDGPLIDCKSLGLRNTTQQKITEILAEIYEILANSPVHDSSLLESINLESSQPSLGSIIAESKGNEAAELIEKALASGADVNDQSRNGHRPLQLLIRAQIDQRLKIELIKQLIERGADVNFADNSGLTPFQTAVAEGKKEIADLLLLKGARKLVPPGIGYAQYYNMYLQLPQ